MVIEVGPVFDEQSFEHFRPLLQVSADYAQQSGFRFRKRDFYDLQNPPTEYPSLSPGEARAQERSFAARMRAAPMVWHFADRLRSGDPWLAEELERAVHSQMQQGVRNAMVSTCCELSLFPPRSPGASKEAPDDAASLERLLSAPLETLVQRLYCDDATAGSERSHAMTAAFLADFASEAGATLPDVSVEYLALWRKFDARVSEWKSVTTDRSLSVAMLGG